MAVVWNLYRFDYSRYVQVRPHLRKAQDPAAFAALAEGPEADAIVEALIEGDVDVIAARHAFLIAYCCVGEPLPCTRRFPRILKRLRQDVRTEVGTEMLADALAAGKNLESWLLPDAELVGFLTPAEAKVVLDAYRMAETRYKLARQPRSSRVRRGGLLQVFSTFFRRLFDRGLAADEMYRLLGELLEDAAIYNQGIAVVSV
jgi:hypothetical protein